LLFALALVLAELGFFFAQARKITDLGSNQSREHRVLFHLREVLSDLQDAETGQPGFLLTGDLAYLAPYTAARSRLFSDLENARMASSESRYLSELAIVEKLSNAKLAELDRTVQLAQQGQPLAAQRIVLEGSGKVWMDTIRRIVTKAMDRARAHRDADGLEVSRLTNRASVVLGLICASVFLLILYAWMSIARSARTAALLAQQLGIEASRDLLTGLFNRRSFERWLDQTIAICARECAEFALLSLDLDGFKPINDQLGHAAGDEVLREVAERFAAAVREADVLARVGGDEFAVIVSPMKTQNRSESSVNG
jgi:CHASE3 domain sensor protein